MAVCYNKLWKLLIDRKMKKKDLIEQTGISRTTIAKMGRDENVSTDVLSKICGALNVDIGDIVEKEFLKSFEIRKELKLKEYVIMPNHIHMIVVLRKDRVTMYNKDNIPVLFRKPKSISSFVSSFKSSTIRQIDDWIDESNVDIPKFNRENPLWQSNYYDNIIKNEQELINVSNYIIANPKNWNKDEEYNGEFLY